MTAAVSAGAAELLVLVVRGCRRVLCRRWCGGWGVPAGTVRGAVDEVGGDLVEADVAGLGDPAEDVEGFGGGAVLGGDDDADGLVDDPAGAQRSAQAAGQGDLVVVGQRAGHARSGEVGEASDEVLDGRLVEGVRGGGIHVQRPQRLPAHHQRRGVHGGDAVGDDAGRVTVPADLGGQVGRGDMGCGADGLQAGAFVDLVLMLVEEPAQAVGGGRGQHAPVGGDGDPAGGRGGHGVGGEHGQLLGQVVEALAGQQQPGQLGVGVGQRRRERLGNDGLDSGVRIATPAEWRSPRTVCARPAP
ncbi:MAG TPA: hypothetical protein VK935_08785 [Actinomycetospora sp.]|nr:hypothetical protein [Actinomycetospora sp.]